MTMSPTITADGPLGFWEDARPEWDDFTLNEQLEHIELHDLGETCAICEDHRAWGICPSCGSEPVEALPPEELSRCCGSRVIL